MLPNREQLLNGYINSSHFINFEECEEIANISVKIRENLKLIGVLLKLLLMRSCALALSAGQMASISLFLFCWQQQTVKRPVYSYIGFQSRSSMDFLSLKLIAKTKMHYYLRKCCGVGGCSQGVCQRWKWLLHC